LLDNAETWYSGSGMMGQSAMMCRRCGTCCLAHLFAYVTPEDEARWRREGRDDILEAVDAAATVWAGDRIVSRTDGRSAAACPFLITCDDHCACGIYDTRPQVCRAFKPGSSRICPLWQGGSCARDDSADTRISISKKCTSADFAS